MLINVCSRAGLIETVGRCLDVSGRIVYHSSPPRVKEDAETHICCSQTRSVQDIFVAKTLPRSGVFNNLDEPHDSKGSIHLFEGKGG